MGIPHLKLVGIPLLTSFKLNSAADMFMNSKPGEAEYGYLYILNVKSTHQGTYKCIATVTGKSLLQVQQKDFMFIQSLYQSLRIYDCQCQKI